MFPFYSLLGISINYLFEAMQCYRYNVKTYRCRKNHVSYFFCLYALVFNVVSSFQSFKDRKQLLRPILLRSQYIEGCYMACKVLYAYCSLHKS